MEAKVKTLRSQLDEIGAVLEAIPSPLDHIPAVTAFQQLQQAAISLSGCCAPAASTSQDSRTNSHGSSYDLATTATAAAGSVLDWSALPLAVAPDSMAMGVSTRKKAAHKPPKKSVDQQKVQARAERKRAQVESFLLVLQPVLQAAGHSLTAAAIQAGSSSSSSTQQACSSGMHAKQPSPDQQGQCQTSYHCQQQQQQHFAAQPQPQPMKHPLSLHIVDFGCGSGNLLLPLAALLPGCQFTGVDMKPAALKLLMQRAADAGLSNVSVFEGMIEQYRQPFDVALALHACGNATDHVLQMAVDQCAAFMVSPCCVGKLRFSLTGGSSFHSKPITWTPTHPGDRPVQAQADSVQPPAPQQKQQQQAEKQQQAQQQPQQPQQQAQQRPQQQRAPSCAGPPHQQQQQQGQQPELQELHEQQQQQQDGGVPKLRHPRSDWLMSQLPDPEQHFKIMAKVADVSHAPSDRAELAEALKQRMNVADMCKRFVELDRCAAAAEAGYAVGLFKVLQADSMAKNDLLVGLPLPLTPGAVVDSCAQPAAAAASAGAPAVTATPTDASSADAPAAAAGEGGDAEAAAGCVNVPSDCLGADQTGLCAEEVRRCFCQFGEAMHAVGVLFAKDRLCAGCRLQPAA